jgi:hypothetical protein
LLADFAGKSASNQLVNRKELTGVGVRVDETTITALVSFFDVLDVVECAWYDRKPRGETGMEEGYAPLNNSTPGIAASSFARRFSGSRVRARTE